MIIAIEGIDGAGKGTQAELLKLKAQSVGLKAEVVSFPRYNKTLFAKCIAAHLNGEYGDLDTINASTAALLFAGDRFESLAVLKELSRNNDILILDRYTSSNIAHQGARVDAVDRLDFMQWLAKLEYETLALPKAAITIYLDVPADIAMRMISTKQKREYTSASADIYERDTQHLMACREVYQTLAAMNFHSHWLPIQCVEATGQLRQIEEIHDLIWHAIKEIMAGSENYQDFR